MMKNKYKVMITSCWVLLIICFVLKIFGANWFEPVLTDGNFVEFCNWLDVSFARYLPMSIIYSSSAYLIYLCMTKQKFFKDWYLLLVLLPMPFIKTNFVIIGLIIDLLTLILLPLIKNKFKNWKRVILGNVLVVVFQLLSLLTKNIGWYLPSDSLVVSTILSIDYYIMLVLYYLYTHYEKKGE